MRVRFIIKLVVAQIITCCQILSMDNLSRLGSSFSLHDVVVGWIPQVPKIKKKVTSNSQVKAKREVEVQRKVKVKRKVELKVKPEDEVKADAEVTSPAKAEGELEVKAVAGAVKIDEPEITGNGEAQTKAEAKRDFDTGVVAEVKAAANDAVDAVGCKVEAGEVGNRAADRSASDERLGGWIQQLATLQEPTCQSDQRRRNSNPDRNDDSGIRKRTRNKTYRKDADEEVEGSAEEEINRRASKWRDDASHDSSIGN